MTDAELRANDECDRLTYKQKSFILAKDTARNRVKLGGLGVFGVGVMWVKAESRHINDPKWAIAPEEESFILHEDARHD